MRFHLDTRRDTHTRRKHHWRLRSLYQATLLPGRFPREPVENSFMNLGFIFIKGIILFKEMYVWDPKLASGKAILVNLFQNVP